MITSTDVIKKIQELNDNDDFDISIQVKPVVECYESILGIGEEQRRYTYTITLVQKEPTIRKYKVESGIKKYIIDEENNYGIMDKKSK